MGILLGADLDQSYTAAQLDEGKTPGVGDVFMDRTGKCYRFVLYDTGAGAVAAAVGGMTGYYAPSGVSTGVTTTVTSDFSDTARVGAGVLMSTPGDGEYCWIQTTGEATLTTTLTAGADGNAMTLLGAGDGTLDVSALVTDHVCAVAIDASADIVYLTCP